MWVWWAFNVLTPPYPGSGCLVKYWQLASLTTIIMCSPTTDHGEIFFKEIFIFLVSYFLNLETKVGKKWQILVINMAEFSLFSSFYFMNLDKLAFFHALLAFERLSTHGSHSDKKCSFEVETVEEVGTKHCHNEGHSALSPVCSGKRQFFSCYYYWRVFCESCPGPPWHWGAGPGLKREIKIQTSLELKPNWLALTTQGIWATLAMLWHSMTVYLKIMNALDVSCACGIIYQVQVHPCTGFKEPDV